MAKALQTLAAQHPDKIEGWYKDSDGYWIDLRPGWRREQFDYVHAVHENTAAAAVRAFRLVHPCDCDDCENLLTQATGRALSKVECASC